jgi:hypothetical protein
MTSVSVEHRMVIKPLSGRILPPVNYWILLPVLKSFGLLRLFYRIVHRILPALSAGFENFIGLQNTTIHCFGRFDKIKRMVSLSWASQAFHESKETPLSHRLVLWH